MLVGKNTIPYGFLCCLSIECFQLVTRRGYFEVDDVLHNTLGVIVGYLLYLLLIRVFAKEKK